MAAAYTRMSHDEMTQKKVRESPRIINVTVVIATGLDAAPR